MDRIGRSRARGALAGRWSGLVPAVRRGNASCFCEAWVLSVRWRFCRTRDVGRCLWKVLRVCVVPNNLTADKVTGGGLISARATARACCRGKATDIC
jgi:hypothetical protein